MRRPGVGALRRNSFRGIGGAQLWTPALLGSKLTLWLDERGQTVTGAGCSQWDDQTTAGTFDFVQTVDSARPPLSTVNGRSAPDFIPNDYMTNANGGSSFTSASASFVAVVTDTTGETPGADNANPWLEPGVFALGSTSGWIQMAWSASGPRAYGFDGGVRVTARVADSTGGASDVGLALLVVKHDGVTFSLRRGTGTAQTVACGSLTTAGTAVNLGCNYNATAFHNGRIAFVITCNAALTTGEEDALRGYLRARYGVNA